MGGTVLDYQCKVKDANSGYTTALDFSESIGGMAYNTATACAQLGLRTELVSAVGSDFPKLKLPKKLKLNLTRKKGGSTWCLLTYDDKGGEGILFHRGPYHDIDLRKARKAIASAKWVHFAGFAPNFVEMAAYAARKKKTISFNPGYDLFHYPKGFSGIKRIAGMSGLLVLSANEAKHFGAKPVKGRIVVITRGRKGSEILAGGKTIRIPAFPVKQKSPFGAGDTYTGALISSLFKGKDIAEAARLASAAASFAVEGETTTPKLSWSEIEKRAGKLK
jgi:ribokinase